MQRYLNEFSFRSNHREHGNRMFDLVVGALCSSFVKFALIDRFKPICLLFGYEFR